MNPRMDPNAQDDTAASAKRIEILRQRLEQYNAAIAEAMNVATRSKERHGDTIEGQSLVPPTIVAHQEIQREVERALEGEFTAATRRSASAIGTPPPAPPAKDDDGHSVEFESDREHSPQPHEPQYTMVDLETSFHRLGAIEQSARVLASIGSTKYSSSNEERVRVLGDLRDELLALEKEQREIREQGIETWTVLASSESNVFAQAKMLLEECEAAKKCFSAIYERKATIYAKEKQLERLAAEMQRFHAELQTQRQSVTSLETRIDHRSRALARRKEQYAATSAAQKERESDVKSRIEKIEALNAKVSSWIRIIETRDRELAAKEERLRNVQMELNRRGEVIAARRK